MLALVLVAELVWALSYVARRRPLAARPRRARVSSVREIGRVLFTDYAFPFEATSILILVGDGRLHRAGEARKGSEAPVITLNHYLVLSAILFAIGTAGVFLRRNVITVLLSIEIMLNAVNLTFVAAGRHFAAVDGQIIVFFVMTVAAAEAAVGLALVIALFRHRESLNPDAFTSLKW